MKHIVLYTCIIASILIQDAAGQKPVIDLLPSDHGQVHTAMAIDTSFTCDSLLRVIAPDNSYSMPDAALFDVQVGKPDLPEDPVMMKWIIGMLKNGMIFRIYFLTRSISI